MIMKHHTVDVSFSRVHFYDFLCWVE